MRQFAQTLDTEVSSSAREKHQPVFDLHGGDPFRTLSGVQRPPLTANSRLGAEHVCGHGVPEQGDGGDGETCKGMYKHIESDGSVCLVGVDWWLRGREHQICLVLIAGLRFANFSLAGSRRSYPRMVSSCRLRFLPGKCQASRRLVTAFRSHD